MPRDKRLKKKLEERFPEADAKRMQAQIEMRQKRKKPNTY